MAGSATDVLFSSSSINRGFPRWTEQVPIGFSQWKELLSKLSKAETVKRLSSTSDRSRRSTSRQYPSAKQKHERNSLSRNQVFNDNPAVDSFLLSSSSHSNPSSIVITRQEAPKITSSPKKRYVSSFKTLINSTNDKHTQRLNYINDSVVILKLSKDRSVFGVSAESSTGATASQLSSKNSAVTLTTSVNPTSTLLKQPSASSSSNGLSPILKVEGQRRRIVNHDATLTTTSHLDLDGVSTSSPNVTMINPSLSAYRTTLASSGTTNRQRAATDSSSSGLLFTTERIKSNISLSVRPLRPSLTATGSSMSSAYLTPQPTQRHAPHQIRSRLQHDRLAANRDMHEYPDPFNNCPQEILNKLSQLTKLQLETIDWEKKRRFTKKKPLANSTIPQGKDTP